MSDRPDLAERAFRESRKRDTAFVLPMLGLLLIVSPIVNIFAGITTVWGIPASVFYVFVVWLTLIGLTWRLSRRLLAED